MTLFPAFAWLFVQTVGEKRRSTDLSEKIKLHGGLKLRILFLVLKTIFYHSKIKFTSSCRCVISSIRLMRESLLPFFYSLDLQRVSRAFSLESRGRSIQWAAGFLTGESGRVQK